VTPSTTPTATPTNTPLPPTVTPTATPTNTPLPPTVTPSATPTVTPTNTPLPPTVTPSATPTVTPTNTPLPPTVTPSATPTATPTNTPPTPPLSPTPIGTRRKISPAIDASNRDDLEQTARVGRGELRAIAYSSDGETLIIGTPIGFVVYTLDTLLEEPHYISTTFSVDSLAVSPSGQLAIGLDDGWVQLWDMDSWEPVQSFSADEQAISSVTFSADGSHIATGSEKNVKVWKVDDDTFSRKRTIEHESTVHSVALSSDGSFLATGTDNQLNVWRTRDGMNVSPSFSDLPHTSEMVAVAFSADNHYLASASADEVYLWDVISNPAQDSLKLTSLTLVSSTPDVTSLAFSPDETELTIGLSNGITSWQIEDNTLTPDSLITGFSKDINRVAISSNDLLASGTLNGQIHLWRLDDGLLLSSTTPRHTTIRGLAFSPDGSRLAAGFADGSVRIWKIQNDTLVYSGKYTHDHFVNSIAFSAKNQLVSVSDDGIIWFWGDELNTQVSLPSKVKSVAFSPDGTFIVAGSADGKVWTVDVDTLATTPIRTHQSAVSSVVVSSNNCLASASVNEIQVQQISEPCPLVQIVASSQITNSDITQIVFSNDNSLLVSVSDNHYINVWEVHASRLDEVLSYEALAGVSDVAISHDGSVLAFAFKDGTVRLWAIKD
ncbi:MAG: WD40 repeat domain-containing protein, partial [Candidatus Promineifilaceae bacterium]